MTYDVKIHDINRRDDRRGRPWRVRWVVAGRRHERRYATKALADHFRSELMSACRRGEAFDEDTGLPNAAVKNRLRTTWYEHARAYMRMKWPHLAAKSRRANAEALATVTAQMATGRGAPPAKELRRALFLWAFNPSLWNTEPDEAFKPALRWLERNSIPVVQLAEPEKIRSALDACARKVNGGTAAASTTRRKRAVLHNALGYAVELGLLDSNPIAKVQWKAPTAAYSIDRRVVASTAIVESILECLPQVDRRGRHYVAFFGCMYYAGMRPSEVAQLKLENLTLPATGWGRLLITETAPHAGHKWTDDGNVRDVRGLKHRGETEIRNIPIPPELVHLLRSHVDEFGTAPDGRLFSAVRGGYVLDTVTSRMWRDARRRALTNEQLLSPLVARPYDLRHAAVSLWLNNGVPAPEVARRAGHGVDVLLRVYAGCIDGEEEFVNDSISSALELSRRRGPSRGQEPHAGGAV